MTETEKELIALRLWKEDALEAIADHNRAYAAQDEMLKEMHDVIGKVADALHSAQLCLNGYVEIKDHFLMSTKKRKTKVPNASVSGAEPKAERPTRRDSQTSGDKEEGHE